MILNILNVILSTIGLHLVLTLSYIMMSQPSNARLLGGWYVIIFCLLLLTVLVFNFNPIAITVLITLTIINSLTMGIFLSSDKTRFK